MPFKDLREFIARLERGGEAQGIEEEVDWKPEDVPKRVSFSDSYPSEIQKKATATWSRYGY